jgi:hypothetical protein
MKRTYVLAKVLGALLIAFPIAIADSRSGKYNQIFNDACNAINSSSFNLSCICDSGDKVPESNGLCIFNGTSEQMLEILSKNLTSIQFPKSEELLKNQAKTKISIKDGLRSLLVSIKKEYSKELNKKQIYKLARQAKNLAQKVLRYRDSFDLDKEKALNKLRELLSLLSKESIPPIASPSISLTVRATVNPTNTSSAQVTKTPSAVPSVMPSAQPTAVPTAIPTNTKSPAKDDNFQKQFPAQILNLTNWKQTLPTGQDEKPTEILQPQLNTFRLDPFFVISQTEMAVLFRSPVNGVTTSGSSYPRSELREMINNGKDKASWSNSSGMHSMYIDQAITVVPTTKKHIVAGQIHDANDDVIVIRLEHPKLFIDINGSDGPTLDSNYTLGRRFSVKFEASDGKIKVFYNNSSLPSYTLNKAITGAYFKAGAYTQSNCTRESNCSINNYGEVKIYDLKVSHN